MPLDETLAFIAAEGLFRPPTTIRAEQLSPRPLPRRLNLGVPSTAGGTGGPSNRAQLTSFKLPHREETSMGNYSKLLKITVVAGLLSGCGTSYSPEQISGPRLSIRDAFKAVAVALRDFKTDLNPPGMDPLTLGVKVCRISVQFNIAVQASQNNSFGATLTAPTPYVTVGGNGQQANTAAATNGNLVYVELDSADPNFCARVANATGTSSQSAFQIGTGTGGTSGTGGSKSTSTDTTGGAPTGSSGTPSRPGTTQPRGNVSGTPSTPTAPLTAVTPPGGGGGLEDECIRRGQVYLRKPNNSGYCY